MSRKKSSKTANINITLYDGEFQVGFDCAGVEKCRFALCPIMPPTGDEECTYRDYGSCMSTLAQQTALEAINKMIMKEMKRYEVGEI